MLLARDRRRDGGSALSNGSGCGLQRLDREYLSRSCRGSREDFLPRQRSERQGRKQIVEEVNDVLW